MTNVIGNEFPSVCCTLAATSEAVAHAVQETMRAEPTWVRVEVKGPPGVAWGEDGGEG